MDNLWLVEIDSLVGGRRDGEAVAGYGFRQLAVSNKLNALARPGIDYNAVTALLAENAHSLTVPPLVRQKPRTHPWRRRTNLASLSWGHTGKNRKTPSWLCRSMRWMPSVAPQVSMPIMPTVRFSLHCCRMAFLNCVYRSLASHPTVAAWANICGNALRRSSQVVFFGRNSASGWCCEQWRAVQGRSPDRRLPQDGCVANTTGLSPFPRRVIRSRFSLSLKTCVPSTVVVA